jgi:chromate reductase
VHPKPDPLGSILGNIKVIVLPEQVTIPKAAEAFDEAGNLKDPKKLDQVQSLMRRLVQVSAALTG